MIPTRYGIPSLLTGSRPGGGGHQRIPLVCAVLRQLYDDVAARGPTTGISPTDTTDGLMVEQSIWESI